ncbi:MAG: endonuclease III [candidate division NC10 bacterium]|nr:endonuclease III [candidate division NC10 bacterium]
MVAAPPRRRAGRALDIEAVVRTLKRAVGAWTPTAVAQVQAAAPDPFRVLVSCLLSLRTKDAVTEAAARRLFALADTPAAILALPRRAIERAIYPVGFYRVKARTLHGVCRDLLARFAGRVPDTLEDLLTLKGVGRKTANLVVTVGYNKAGICVDTHVHRICNRWGYARTKTPAETERALRATLPRRHWIVFNDLLVPFGQNCCKPLSPLCSRCPVEAHCPKVGVTRHR